MKTKEQALRDLGLVVTEAVERMRKLTPREVAEAAWQPGHTMSIEELVVHAAVNGLCRPEYAVGLNDLEAAINEGCKPHDRVAR